MQEQKSEQHREWLPADARKAHGCAICAAALPAQKREKNFLKKFKKMLDKIHGTVLHSSHSKQHDTV